MYKKLYKWWHKPFGPADKIRFTRAYLEYDVYWGFRSWFSKTVLGRCGGCGLKLPSHKMDCSGD